MAEHETPYEKLKKANDDYHESVQEILLDGELDVATKVNFANHVRTVFANMVEADKVIEAHYAQGD